MSHILCFVWLQVLTTIVKQSKSTASSLSSMICPLIHFAIVESYQKPINSITGDDDNIDTSEYLVEEGVSLWLSLARNYHTTNDESMSLFNLCLHALFKSDDAAYADLGLESLKEIMMIVEVHAILGGGACLQACAPLLKDMYDRVLGSVAPRVVPYIIRPLEAFALSCPNEISLFAFQTRILENMIKSCMSYVPGLEEAMKKFHESEVAVVSYLSFICRIIVCAPHVLMEVLNNVVIELINQGVAPAGTTANALLLSVVRLLINMVDMAGSCAGGTWRRKLWALALLSLYPNDQTLFEVFPDVLLLTESVICEELEDSNTNDQDTANRFALSMAAQNTEDAAFIGQNAVDVDTVTRLMGDLVCKDVVMRSSLLAIAQDKVRLIRLALGDGICGQLLQPLPQNTVNRFIVS